MPVRRGLRQPGFHRRLNCSQGHPGFSPHFNLQSVGSPQKDAQEVCSQNNVTPPHVCLSSPCLGLHQRQGSCSRAYSGLSAVSVAVCLCRCLSICVPVYTAASPCTSVSLSFPHLSACLHFCLSVYLCMSVLLKIPKPPRLPPSSKRGNSIPLPILPSLLPNRQSPWLFCVAQQNTPDQCSLPPALYSLKGSVSAFS